MKVQLEKTLQAMKPLFDRIIRPINEWFDSRYERPAWYKTPQEGTPICRHILAENTFYWWAFSNIRSSIFNSPTYPCSVATFMLKFEPLRLSILRLNRTRLNLLQKSGEYLLPEVIQPLK